MQVQIRGEVKELPVQTITLQPEAGNNMYAFHCTSCGHMQQQIGGKVSKIYPVYEPSDQVPAISRCRHCGKKYMFQTHDGYSSDKVKVVLSPSPDTNFFYCYMGEHTKILEYTPDMIYSHADHHERILPFFASCPDTPCEIVYYFTNL